MRKIKILVFALVTLALTNATAAPGGYDHGNGGGVICVNQQCKTLSESGLIMSAQYPDFWIPSEEVLENINKLVASYPFEKQIRTKILHRILLKMTHFKAVDVIDQTKLDTIKQLYLDTIKTASPQFDSTNFTIVAISSDNTAVEQNTYILPGFFSLNPLQQAEMLIHEGLYRGQPSASLRYILQLESALTAFKKTETGLPQDKQSSFRTNLRKNMVSAQIAAYHLGIINNAETFSHMISSTYSNIAEKYAEYETKTPDSFWQIFTFLPYPEDRKFYLLSINQEFVHTTSNLDARTAVMLLNLKVPFVINPVGYGSYLKKLWDPVYGFKTMTGYYTEGNNYALAEPAALNLLLPK